jgi:predicted aspartyl protease/RNA polymerase subunit RPABC4/transcription elongation factor Spt4
MLIFRGQMNCKYCNTTVPATVAYCPVCGKALQKTDLPLTLIIAEGSTVNGRANVPERDASCRRCDAPLEKGFTFCPQCGRHLLPFCWPPSIEGSILAAFILFLGVGVGLDTFNHMTSAQHPAEATNAQTETTERAQAASKGNTAAKSALEAPAPATLEIYQAATKGDPIALRELRTKAENGDSLVQFTLGYMYGNGQGVPKDPAQAGAWYSRAAEQGNSYSQNNLGVMYRDGEGVPKDEAQAVVWFRKAADRGLPDAQFNLGVMYHNGQGVPQDLAQAEAWYRKAAKQGDADAKKNLKLLAEAQPKTFRVPLKHQNGVLYVPVLINDSIPLDFIIDSGAADVQVPADVVSTLMRTGTLKATDFTGTNTYVLADGSMAPSQTFRIRSLKVGNWVLENVPGSVGSREGSLLLGQSFLSQFKSWSIDNSGQVLVLSN